MTKLIISVVLLAVAIFSLNTLNDIERYSKSEVAVEKPVPVVVSVIGDPCDDGKEETINDIYLSSTGLCVGLIERDEVTCKGDKIGSEFFVNGEIYLVVDNKMAKENLDKIETLCLSNVTDPIILDLDHRQFRNFELEDSSLKHN